jgi:hypothetical protein
MCTMLTEYLVYAQYLPTTEKKCPSELFIYLQFI